MCVCMHVCIYACMYVYVCVCIVSYYISLVELLDLNHSSYSLSIGGFVLLIAICDFFRLSFTH